MSNIFAFVALITMFIIIAATIIAVILYFCSLYKTMKYVPPEKRIFPNAFIWLTLTPCLGLIFFWLMLPFGIPRGLKNATIDNPIAASDADSLKKLGFVFMVLHTLIFYFLLLMITQGIKHYLAIYFVVGTPAFILWIVYWTKVVSFRKKYLENKVIVAENISPVIISEPKLLTTKICNETFAGVTYHIEGELVPALTIELNGSTGIYFEHHVVLWKTTSLDISIKKLAGVFRRVFSGLPVFMTQTQGNGLISFSRNGAGQILPLHMKLGEELIVREHRFLAATNNIDYSFEVIRGIANKAIGAGSFLIDRFHCTQNEGILWLHGCGNVFEKTLGPGEQIDLRLGAWLYRDPTVQMETRFQNLTTGLLASSGGLITNRFTGPGRIGIQSFVDLF